MCTPLITRAMCTPVDTRKGVPRVGGEVYLGEERGVPRVEWEEDTLHMPSCTLGSHTIPWYTGYFPLLGPPRMSASPLVNGAAVRGAGCMLTRLSLVKPHG